MTGPGGQGEGEALAVSQATVCGRGEHADASPPLLMGLPACLRVTHLR